MESAQSNSEAVTVRLLRADDSLEALTSLLHRAFARFARYGIAPVAATQSVEVTRQRIEGGECYIAELDGKMAGTILLRPPGVLGPRGGTPHLSLPSVASFSQFAVDPDFTGRGVGTALMDLAERRARLLGASELALSTPEPATDLVAMYEARGYVRFERWRWEGMSYDSLILAKKLQAGRVPVE